MEEIEVVLLEMILSLARIGKPVMLMQALEIANSLVKNTEKEEEIKEWKWKHLKMKDPQHELGREYWCNFYTRHHDVLTTKKAVRFDQKRAEWCTKENLCQMYEKNYGYWSSDEAGNIAVELTEPIWFDKAGNEVADETLSFGRKTKYKIVKPELLLFVDKVGANTSQ